ncbi:MAG: 1-deoxy-D-xylulose-5-phosphate reductoisomerase [Phycisphaerales bacterium]
MARTPRLIVLGSTGSIGTATLDVVEHLAATGGRRYQVVGLAAGANEALVREQAARFGVKHVAVAHSAGHGADQRTDPRTDQRAGGCRSDGLTLYRGADAALQLVQAIAEPGDMVMAAMVGAAGLAPTLAAIERGCDIALANKETLVAAGALVMPAVAQRGVRLLPVDSEHSAVLQCMRAGTGREVRRVVLTASGGPFRTWSAERTHAATLGQALNHPTWKMGRKVTIDSASLMNKGLEVIEAHWLFGLPAEQVDAIIHPQSVVHSFVEFADGSVIAQLSPPSMKLPIQYALDLESRVDGCSPALDWSALRSLEFQPVDHERFPAIQLAHRVIRTGGTSGAIFNAANEVAVEAFIAGQIPFGEIPHLVSSALDALDSTPVTDLACIQHADLATRNWCQARLSPLSARD